MGPNQNFFKICRVTRAFMPLRDGISHHTYHLSKYQAALGHKVWVLQPHQPSGMVEGFQVKQVSLGPFTPKYRYKSVTTLLVTRCGLELIRLHGRYGLDIIHGHGDIIEAFILRQFARFLNLPLVMTIHSGLNRRQRYRMIAPWVWGMVDGIIVVSREIAMDLERLGVYPGRLTVISSGVDINRFTPDSNDTRRKARFLLGIPDSAFVITSVGRLTPMKGFKYLIEAIQLLPDMDSIQLYILGSGPLKEALEAILRGTPQIHLLGSQPHDRVRDYLNAADLFILPSVDRPGETEGTPTVVMEAMATGLPIIATNSGGAKHVIARIQGVTVVPQRNSRALANAISRLAQDSGLRKHIGQLNRERIKSKDWPRIASAVCQFYEMVIAHAK